MIGQETEMKFYVSNLNKIEMRLGELGAVLIQPRVHETNLRFDTPNGDLRKEGKALRLRLDETAKMTFKGQTNAVQGVASRKEIEFEIGDFLAGRELIESLGYELSAFYEKFRITYDLNNNHIMLDELPYGDFVEIEGEDIESIHKIADLLRLTIDHAVEASYLALFEGFAKTKGMNPASLSFEAFKNWKPSAKELSVARADNEE